MHMAKFLSEKAILTKLKTPSFESLTDDQLAIFSSILYKMHPKVSRAAMDNFLDFQHDAQIILQSLKKKSSRGMDYSDSDDLSIQKYIDQVMHDVEDRLQRADFTFGDKLYVEDNLILLSQLIALYKLNFKKLILNEIKYMAKGAAMLAPVILLFAYFFHRSASGHENNDDAEERKLLKYPSSVNPTANVTKQAPVLVLIFRDKLWISYLF